MVLEHCSGNGLKVQTPQLQRFSWNRSIPTCFPSIKGPTGPTSRVSMMHFELETGS